MSFLTLPGLLALLSSCSPVGLTGSEVDQDLKKPVPYRVMQAKCSNLQLQDSALGKGISTHDFRGLLSCFNSNGDLDPIEKGVTGLSDSELEVILLPMNQSLLGSAENFSTVQLGYELLSKWGLLQKGLKSVSEFTQNSKLIHSGAEILMASGKPSPQYQKALQILAGHFSVEGSKSLVGAVLAMIESPAWKELVKSLQTSADDATGSAANQATSLRRYLLAKAKDPKANLFQMLLEGLADQSLFKVTDRMLGKELTEVREGVSEVSTVMRWSFKNQEGGRWIDQALGLFRFADRPVECFRKSIRIEDPITFFVGEVSRLPRERVRNYLQVETPQNLVGVTPFCEIPPGLNAHYQNFLRISYLPQLERAHSCIIQSFYESGRFDLLRSFLVDPLSVEILPSLSRLNADRSWEDLFLVASSIRPEDRTSVASTATFLSQKRTDLGNRSVFETLTSEWASADESHWISFFEGIVSLGSSPDNTLEKMLQSARALQFATNKNTLLDCLQKILESPDLMTKWFSAAIKFERSSDYTAALSLVSTMAEDGRLQEMIDQTLRLFSRLGTQSSIKANGDKVLPPFNLSDWLRHTWASADLPIISEVESQKLEENDCLGVNIEINLFSPQSANYPENFERVKKCFGAKWATVLDTLHDGNYLSLGAQTLSRFKASQTELQDFMSRWSTLEKSGEFEALIKTVPVFVQQRDFKESVTKVLSQAIRSEGSGLQPVLSKLAESIRGLDRRSLSNSLRSVFKNYDAYERPEPIQKPFPISIEKTKKGVAEQECLTDKKVIEARANEIARETESAINSGDLVDGKPRSVWKKGELKVQIQEVLKNMTEPLMNGVLTFIRFYGLGQDEAPNAVNQHEPKELLNWLNERSNDYKMISYYYPDEKTPRVKWVNSIDAFELLVANVDFSFITKDNYGLKFFAEIAQAWGDEPEELWPAEIKSDFLKTGVRPPTTQEVYVKIEKMLKSIEGVVGYPKLPRCGEPLEGDVFSTSLPGAQPGFAIAHFVPRSVRAAIFNLRQLLPVIQENIIGSHHAHDGGIRLIRELFYALRSTTPEKARSASAGDANHLSLVAKIVKLGALHEIGHLVRSTDEGDQDSKQFVEGLIFVTHSPEFYPAFKKVLVDDLDHRLVFNGLDLLEGFSNQNKLNQVGRFLFYGMGSVQNLDLANEFSHEFGITISKYDQVLSEHLSSLSDPLVNEDVIRLLSVVAHLKNPEERRGLSENAKKAVFQTGALRSILDWGVPFLTKADLIPSLDALRTAVSLATQSAEFKALNLKAWRDRAVDFLGEDGLAQRATEFTVDFLDSGTALEWFKLASRSPNGFESLLDQLADAISRGRLSEFFGLVQRAIDPH